MEYRNPNVLFLSHGGGPLPLLGDESHKEMVETLQCIAAKITKPSAILLISAHWEEDRATLTAGANPSLIYDYYGFPEEAYRIEYPCPGQPVFAERLYKLLSDSGIQVQLDEHRGFDHGLFIPLKIMYPEADIPCVQLSLMNNLSPAEHMKMGSALSSVDDNGLLIIGSGFSFHNMKAFFTQETADSRIMNEQFEQWLLDTCSNSGINEEERYDRLENWQDAPFARYCHPREEHLLPLHVCYGVAGTPCRETYEIEILNKKSSVYLW